MQTQYYGVPPFHSDPYNNIQGVLQPTFPNQYGAIGGGGFIADFSRGSSFSYPHPEYTYFSDRGGPTTSLPSTSLAVSSLDATGLGFTGNPSGTDLFLHPEDIPEYAQEPWQWTGPPCHGLGPLATPVPIAHVHPEPDLFEVNKSTGSLDGSRVCSPTAQLPTPAAMAVLLNHKARSERRHEEGSASVAVAPPPPPAVEVPPQTRAQLNEPVASSPPRAVPDRSDTLSREKKHACTMCHKRFDRPSTLRKHLLVHTGEKAFVCETCGRRFGVASNLNRHVRRCILKPVNMGSSGSGKSSSESPSATASPDTSLSVSPGSSAGEIHAMQSFSSATPPVTSPSDTQQKKKRTRLASPHISSQPTSVSYSDVPSQLPSEQANLPKKPKGPPVQKRRRRAPSPSRWIPFSLLTFNLASEEFSKAVPVPLPPVRFNPPREERNSWDENVGPTPYHPCGWKGVLPGPGLGQGVGLRGKDARNMNFGGSGGFMLGRMVVF